MSELPWVATPRALHPGAWWLWAIGLALVAARTTNPLLLGLVIGVAAFVVAARHEDAPWGRAFGLYLRVALLVVVIRVVFRILLGGSVGAGGTVLVGLPQLPLPDWMAGITVGGDVTAESLLAATYDGLRLAALVACIGAANCLANPRRLLRLLPNALYEVGASISVAVSLTPQLAESVARVRRARRLRPGGGRRRGLQSLLLPVLTDALDRSLSLAAAMDARGYARGAGETVGRRRLTAGLLVVGLVGACIGLYGLLDATAPPAVGLPALAVGMALLLAGFVLADRRVRHTRYRPDAWRGAEWSVVASGVAAVALTLVGGIVDPAALHPSLAPISWPALAVLPTLGVLIAALPAVLAPLPPLRAAAEEANATRAIPDARVAHP